MDTALKFAFVLFKYFPFGGMQRDMLRTATHLVEMGHVVDIYALTWEGPQPAGITVHVLPAKGWFNYQRYTRFIEAVFERLRRDTAVDYVVGYNRMPGLDAHFGADPCFVDRMHKRSVLYRLTPRYHWFARAEKAVFDRAASTEILMVARTEMPIFHHWYGTPPSRMHYIPPYLSAERLALQPRQAMRQHLHREFGIPDAHRVVLLVGSGFTMKGLDRAIAAVASLPADLRATTHLVAIGQDNPRAFRRLAERLGVGGTVHIAKGRQDVPWLMQGADIHMHPARRENTGLVILEGLASGTPVLVTASCGYAHHVQDAQAGRVVPMPFDQAVLNRMLADMLQADPDTWRRNGIAYGRQLMEQNDGRAEAHLLVAFAQQKKTGAAHAANAPNHAEAAHG